MGRSALAALILAGFAPPVAADCAAITGSYLYLPEARASARTDSLASLIRGPDVRYLYDQSRRPRPGEDPDARALSHRVAIKFAPGSTLFRFYDAKGKELAAFNSDAAGLWSCNGSRLERHYDRSRGINNTVRVERFKEALWRDGDALVFEETIVTLDPQGVKPKHSMTRFKALR
jgi:hypothetical protein